MSKERKPLDFPDLDDFQPRKTLSNLDTAKRKEIDKVSAFPSREQVDDAQINIKASLTIINRFKLMAKQERYRHGDFLEILMNAYKQSD
ncbi:hypothetical protein [Candidatus Bartonella washoeensis]|uniref:Uncharacterized protein n=1 Tax=Cardidatus Bartonella washoeensis 085-0475 TaxID=1094564 RepID=J0QB22_9HYPH|nr:hypothetical protein [Bartonella washoeensis]EJF82516.1 hypothetical protein MCW_01647 [Bartonella washoeensis 085-0475]